MSLVPKVVHHTTTYRLYSRDISTGYGSSSKSSGGVVFMLDGLHTVSMHRHRCSTRCSSTMSYISVR